MKARPGSAVAAVDMRAVFDAAYVGTQSFSTNCQSVQPAAPTDKLGCT
ncbi:MULTISPECIES: hypothetical protein [Mycobacterium]|jgi:hypothetical protein|uniref:Uncharacterized protein n=1 Tax=Mycolicibacterium fortuitum TaxID=1766 RepID=A0A378UA48_MYCFO|nr:MULTISPECIES: hypothetical protein [Mycobacterium]MCG7610931.1 hypothetical protein [Mycobacterium sp. CnD-18-1]STZ74207.1 Uncharacterised protein [Mycolicibacterium fortuitum]